MVLYRDPYTLVQPSLPETLLNIDRFGVVLPLLGFTLFYPIYRSGDRTFNNINDQTLGTISTDTSIRHNSFIEDSTFKAFDVEFANSSQVGVAEVGIIERRFGQVSASEIDIAEIGVSEIGLEKNSINQNSTSQVSSSQNSFFKTYPFHVSPIKIGEHKISSVHNSEAKVGILENNISQIGIDQFNLRQIDSSKISFASSISPKQFFSIHNSSPKITNVLNNTATNIWSNLLKSETQLDIDFQITDLPKGQLAEATITDFDENEVPNAGTIFIDHDANGVGWFIDSTPLGNSEFTAHLSSNGENTDSYLLAAAESEASGKYDLLTTVLHELSHLYGFIDGYEGFDESVETKNGTTKFIGDDFEATLDGEHLDKQAYPHDLLNTRLAPGMRKLPSELDSEAAAVKVPVENTAPEITEIVIPENITEGDEIALNAIAFRAMMS